MVNSKEMPIYHPNSQDELSASSVQNRPGRSNPVDNTSTMDDVGVTEKLPESAVPKFEYLDKFKSADARRDRDQDQQGQDQGGFSGGNDGAKKRKRVPKEEAADFYRATPRTLSAGLFPVIDGMTTMLPDEADTELEDLELSLDEAFKEWNDSFSTKAQQKRKPPAVSPIKPSYVRQEFQPNRSAHMWKTDPKKPAILTFGPFKTFSNKVVEILFKYQNNTLEAKA